MRGLVAALAGVLVLGASACGGGSGDGAGRLPAGLGDAIRSASESQRKVLKDGHVSWDEYEAATLATVECLRTRGVKIGVEPHRIPGQRIEFAWTSSTDEESASSASVYDECYREYQSLVDTVWTYQTLVPESRQNEARDTLVQCLRDTGVDLSPEPSRDELRIIARENPVFGTCRQAVSEEFDILEATIGS